MLNEAVAASGKGTSIGPVTTNSLSLQVGIR
jgi:hypothetical protein